MNELRGSMASLSVDPGVVSVIRIRLDAVRVPMAELEAAVPAEERERAGRFVHDRDRRRHIVGRAYARMALAPLTGGKPEQLRFAVTDLGKPFLPDGPSFSISHSGNEVLIAVAGGGRLGVDVEEVRELRDLQSLARTSFTPPEAETVAGMQTNEQLRAFFRVWTRKEAMLKALGCGLTGLSAIVVSADDGHGNALQRMDYPPGMDRWTVRSIVVDAAVEAAIAWDHPLVALNRIEAD